MSNELPNPHMRGEVDPRGWESCKAPVKVPDWRVKHWARSPDGRAYHLVAERYFPGRGTWHQEVIVDEKFLRRAENPGMAICGLLHSLVPSVKEEAGKRIVDPNLN